jgi:hypothetical protein
MNTTHLLSQEETKRLITEIKAEVARDNFSRASSLSELQQHYTTFHSTRLPILPNILVMKIRKEATDCSEVEMMNKWKMGHKETFESSLKIIYPNLYRPEGSLYVSYLQVEAKGLVPPHLRRDEDVGFPCDFIVRGGYHLQGAEQIKEIKEWHTIIEQYMLKYREKDIDIYEDPLLPYPFVREFAEYN